MGCEKSSNWNDTLGQDQTYKSWDWRTSDFIRLEYSRGHGVSGSGYIFHHPFDPGCVLLPGFSVCLELWGQLFSGEMDGWEDTWVNTSVAYIHIWTDVRRIWSWHYYHLNYRDRQHHHHRHRHHLSSSPSPAISRNFGHFFRINFSVLLFTLQLLAQDQREKPWPCLHYTLLISNSHIQ